MKNKIGLLTLAAATLIGASAHPNKAQALCDDGIAASPRLRAILEERRSADGCTCSDVVYFRDAGYKAAGDDGITASPKLRAMLDERRMAVGGVGSALESSSGVEYNAAGHDVIAPPPKVRQMLKDEDQRSFELVPYYDPETDDSPRD